MNGIPHLDPKIDQEGELYIVDDNLTEQIASVELCFDPDRSLR
jgi:hypothetical protein